MRIYNSIGQMIAKIRLEGGNNTLATGYIPSGLYTIVLDSESFTAK